MELLGGDVSVEGPHVMCMRNNKKQDVQCGKTTEKLCSMLITHCNVENQ